MSPDRRRGPSPLASWSAGRCCLLFGARGKARALVRSADLGLRGAGAALVAATSLMLLTVWLPDPPESAVPHPQPRDRHQWGGEITTMRCRRPQLHTGLGPQRPART